jgi:hypothetical protein
MKTRKWLVAAFGALTLGTFIFTFSYMAPHAYAQPLAQARPVTSASGSTFSICMWEASTECIVSHGEGRQVGVDSRNYAVFHVVNENDQTGIEQLADAGGNCLRAYADNTVGLTTGGCDNSNQAEWWTFSVDPAGRWSYANNKYLGPRYMGTYGTGSGASVFDEPPQSGFFYGWRQL